MQYQTSELSKELQKIPLKRFFSNIFSTIWKFSQGMEIMSLQIDTKVAV